MGEKITLTNKRKKGINFQFWSLQTNGEVGTIGTPHGYYEKGIGSH